MNAKTLAIIGAGNLGTAIARGLLESRLVPPQSLTLTRRRDTLLSPFADAGCIVHSDNVRAVSESDIVILAVEPQQLNRLLDDIGAAFEANRHLLISVISGVEIAEIRAAVAPGVQIIRAMPNTAIAIRESMTTIAAPDATAETRDVAAKIFDSVGKTLFISEGRMTAATALGACGVAFFLRAIRAASQGGIEIGFHSDEALAIAAQVAKGAAALLQDQQNHPEFEIDKVTTPRGCTIAGLNQMEHDGFSSAMIKGITTSANKAGLLYKDD